MPLQEYSTASVAPRDAFAHWNEAVCKVFLKLDCEEVALPRRFAGRLRDRPLSRAKLSDVRSDAQVVNRTPAMVRAADAAFCLVSIQLEGRGEVRQDGRAALLRPGDFAVYDSTRPYQLRFEDRFSQLVLRLDRELLTGRLGPTQEVTARTVAGDRGLGRPLRDFLIGLAREYERIEPASHARIEDATADLLAAALAGAVGTGRPASSAGLALRYRARAVIEDRLAEPGFGPPDVAAAVGVSPRHLARLFEADGTSVSRFIWQRRLERAAEALRDPARRGRDIGEIAYDCGFADTAHFSRAFRRRFGRSPREYRSLP